MISIFVLPIYNIVLNNNIGNIYYSVKINERYSKDLWTKKISAASAVKIKSIFKSLILIIAYKFNFIIDNLSHIV